MLILRDSGDLKDSRDFWNIFVTGVALEQAGTPCSTLLKMPAGWPELPGAKFPPYIGRFDGGAERPAAAVGEGKMRGDGLAGAGGGLDVFPFEMAEVDLGAAKHAKQTVGRELAPGEVKETLVFGALGEGAEEVCRAAFGFSDAEDRREFRRRAVAAHGVDHAFAALDAHVDVAVVQAFRVVVKLGARQIFADDFDR